MCLDLYFFWHIKLFTRTVLDRLALRTHSMHHPPLLWVHAYVLSIILWGVDLTSWFLHYPRGAGNVPRPCSIMCSNLISSHISISSISIIRHISASHDWLHDLGLLGTLEMILQTRALRLNPILSNSNDNSLSYTLQPFCCISLSCCITPSHAVLPPPGPVQAVSGQPV